jgi:acyl-homoserine-lactone acylase
VWLAVTAAFWLLGLAACTTQGDADSRQDHADSLQAPGSIDWNAVARRVEIRRDTFGIPHVIGEDEEAAAFGFGYAQAEDHMVEIARGFVRARGEAARYFGPEEADNDFAMHRFDNLAEAGKALQRITPHFRTIVRAYAAGLNRYAASHASDLPAWVDEFTETDVLALIRARSVSPLISRRVMAQLDAKYGVAAVAVAEPSLREGPGSNAFALAGSRTQSGVPILLANPHLRWSSLYWEAQVTVPGVVDFFGNTLAGNPMLWAGFNENLGWANTVNAADLDDIYALRIDPQHPDSYVFEGRPTELRRRDVTVEVLQDDGSLVEQRRTYWDSHLGPVVHRLPGYAFAVKSVRLDAPVHFEGFYRLAQARNLEEFRAVFRDYPVFSCNFIYGDVEGNILYLWHAMLPKRIEDGTDYSLDVPGDTSKYVWTSLHSSEEMPALLNPPHGIIQNANNPPWWASPQDWIDDSAYASYYQRGPLALRPQLALDLLETKAKYSVQDVLDLKFNTRMLLAERVLPDLLSALRAAAAPSEEARAALETLQHWDRRVAADSRGAVLFKRFWDTYAEAVPQPYATPWNEKEPTTTPRGIADTAIAMRHVEEAVRWVRALYGTESVAWGDVHRLRLGGHDLPGDGADGSYGTFRVMRYADAADGKQVVGMTDKGPPAVGFGDNWIMLLEFAKPVRAWSVLGQGESGDPESPHSGDQIELFQAHKLRPIWFTEDEIRQNLERSYRPG